MDECSAAVDPCANGGQCQNTVGSYSCDCTDTGYTGLGCETGKTFMTTSLLNSAHVCVEILLVYVL